jgi:hypothetical protein
MLVEAQQKLFDRNNALTEMINDPVNPLTNSDLKRLIERNPERYGVYSGFIGKLKD